MDCTHPRHPPANTRSPYASRCGKDEHRVGPMCSEISLVRPVFHGSAKRKSLVSCDFPAPTNEIVRWISLERKGEAACASHKRKAPGGYEDQFRLEATLCQVCGNIVGTPNQSDLKRLCFCHCVHQCSLLLSKITDLPPLTKDQHFRVTCNDSFT